MLGTRVLTAVVALIVLLATAFLAPPQAFDILLFGIVCTALYEWLRLLNVSPRKSLSMSLWLFALMVLALFYVPEIINVAAGNGTPLLWIYAAAVIFWVMAVPLALARRAAVGGNTAAGQSIAILLCCATGFALLHADGLGKGFLLSVLLLVWVADTAAFFAGRAFGRRKLAPQISPGKTWEGVIGALLANAVLAIGLSQVSIVSQANPAGTFFSWMSMSLGILLMLSFTVLITLVSVAGDLYESLLKRIAGVKDSGRLLPGHGGVLDRIDALLAVLPLAMFLVTLMQSGQIGR
jgi:phosphatidate cytidylyltransferase